MQWQSDHFRTEDDSQVAEDRSSLRSINLCKQLKAGSKAKTEENTAQDLRNISHQRAPTPPRQMLLWRPRLTQGHITRK
jgi:hypothetical protein